jgi:hypothetical protein
VCSRGSGAERTLGRSELHVRLWVINHSPQLGAGSGHTAWRRLRAWQAAGVWDQLHQLVLDELSEAEVLDRSRASIDAVSVRAKRGAS